LAGRERPEKVGEVLEKGNTRGLFHRRGLKKLAPVGDSGGPRRKERVRGRVAGA